MKVTASIEVMCGRERLTGLPQTFHGMFLGAMTSLVSCCKYVNPFAVALRPRSKDLAERYSWERFHTLHVYCVSRLKCTSSVMPFRNLREPVSTSMSVSPTNVTSPAKESPLAELESDKPITAAVDEEVLEEEA